MSQDKEVDIYRDTPVRLLGYANEVGEAFRALVHVRYQGLAEFNCSQILQTDVMMTGTGHETRYLDISLSHNKNRIS